MTPRRGGWPTNCFARPTRSARPLPAGDARRPQPRPAPATPSPAILRRADKLLAADGEAEALPLYRDALAAALEEGPDPGPPLANCANLGEEGGLARPTRHGHDLEADWPVPKQGPQGDGDGLPAGEDARLRCRVRRQGGPVEVAGLYLEGRLRAGVDLKEALKDHAEVAAYAAAEFPSKDAREVDVRLGCYTGFKLWVNGELVLERGDAYTGMQLDHYVARARLKATGKNIILLKVTQDEAATAAPADAAVPAPRLRRRRQGGPGRGPQVTTPVTPMREVDSPCGTTACLPWRSCPWPSAPDWRQFRGTDSTGHAAGGAPTEFGADKNVAWKCRAAWPAALSSPIIVDGRVYRSRPAGGPKQTACKCWPSTRKSGSSFGAAALWATGPTDSYPKTACCCPDAGKRRQKLRRRPLRHAPATWSPSTFEPATTCGCCSLYEENPAATDGRARRRRRWPSPARSSSTSRTRTSRSPSGNLIRPRRGVAGAGKVEQGRASRTGHR